MYPDEEAAEKVKTKGAASALSALTIGRAVVLDTGVVRVEVTNVVANELPVKHVEGNEALVEDNKAAVEGNEALAEEVDIGGETTLDILGLLLGLCSSSDVEEVVVGKSVTIRLDLPPRDEEVEACVITGSAGAADEEDTWTGTCHSTKWRMLLRKEILLKFIFILRDLSFLDIDQNIHI